MGGKDVTHMRGNGKIGWLRWDPCKHGRVSDGLEIPPCCKTFGKPFSTSNGSPNVGSLFSSGGSVRSFAHKLQVMIEPPQLCDPSAMGERPTVDRRLKLSVATWFEGLKLWPTEDAFFGSASSSLMVMQAGKASLDPSLIYVIFERMADALEMNGGILGN